MTTTGPTEHDQSDEHFPWHYTEHGVVCACGEPMRDEVCPASPATASVDLMARLRASVEAAKKRRIERTTARGAS